MADKFRGENMNTQKPDAVEFCPDCRHPMNCHHDGRGIWGKGCNQPLAMELQCPCQNTPQTFTAIERLTAERDDLKAEVEVARRLLEAANYINIKANDTSIEIDHSEFGDGKWHLCDDLGCAMPQGYDTALEAFTALEGEPR